MINFRIRPVWMCLVFIPAVANFFLWEFLVLPKENVQRSLEQTERLVEETPWLVPLISESERLLKNWAEQGFLSTDPAVLKKDIQRLSKENGVKISADSMTDGSSPKTKLLKFQLRGSLKKLGQWISAVESRPNLRIENWRLSSATEPGMDSLEIEFEIVMPQPSSVFIETKKGKNISASLKQSLDWARTLDEAVSGYNVVSHRDPFEPLIDFQGEVTNPAGLRARRQIDELDLQGIISGGEKALINDKFYKTGDTVNAYLILQIQPEGVLLKKDNKTIFIGLHSES